MSWHAQLLAVFWTVFDVERGSIVRYQVPADAIDVHTRVTELESKSALSSRAPSRAQSPETTSLVLPSFAGSDALAQSISPQPSEFGTQSEVELLQDTSESAAPSWTQNDLDAENSLRRHTSRRDMYTTATASRSLITHTLSRPTTPHVEHEDSDCLFRFSYIERHVIPHESLANKLTTCSALGTNGISYRVMGVPVRIEGKQYMRNAFMFNLCFVFDAADDTRAFEPVVKKCAAILRELEVSSATLSNGDQSQTINEVCDRLYYDLRVSTETSIPIDSYFRLDLKLFPPIKHTLPRKVEFWDVPVALVDLKAVEELEFDLIMSRIIPHLNGVNCARRISSLTDVEPSLVCRALSQLLSYDAIFLVDIWQATNVYRTTPKLKTFQMSTPQFQSFGAHFVALESKKKTLVSWDKARELLLALDHSQHVEGWMTKRVPRKANFSPHRLVMFGFLHGLIARHHCWPILRRGTERIKEPRSRKSSVASEEAAGFVRHDPSMDLTPRAGLRTKIRGPKRPDSMSKDDAEYPLLTSENLIPLCDGNHSMDELQVHFGYGYREMLHALQVTAQRLECEVDLPLM